MAAVRRAHPTQRPPPAPPQRRHRDSLQPSPAAHSPLTASRCSTQGAPRRNAHALHCRTCCSCGHRARTNVRVVVSGAAPRGGGSAGTSGPLRSCGSSRVHSVPRAAPPSRWAARQNIRQDTDDSARRTQGGASRRGMGMPRRFVCGASVRGLGWESRVREPLGRRSGRNGSLWVVAQVRARRHRPVTSRAVMSHTCARARTHTTRAHARVHTRVHTLRARTPTHAPTHAPAPAYARAFNTHTPRANASQDWQRAL